MQATPTDTDRILRPRRLAEHLGVSLTTLWRMRQRGELPRPIRISAGAVGWRLSKIEAWLSEREQPQD